MVIVLANEIRKKIGGLPLSNSIAFRRISNMTTDITNQVVHDMVCFQLNLINQLMWHRDSS